MSTTCSAQASTPRRSSRSPRPTGGAPILSRGHAGGEPERRRIAGLHGLARHLERRGLCGRPWKGTSTSSARSPETVPRRVTRRVQPAGSASGRSRTLVTNSGSPSLGITSRLINSQDYVVPPPSNQKAAARRLRTASTTRRSQRRLGRAAGTSSSSASRARRGRVDARFGRLSHAAGVVRERDTLGSSGTGVTVGGQVKAGIAWYAVSPKINGLARSRAR